MDAKINFILIPFYHVHSFWALLAHFTSHTWVLVSKKRCSAISNWYCNFKQSETPSKVLYINTTKIENQFSDTNTLYSDNVFPSTNQIGQLLWILRHNWSIFLSLWQIRVDSNNERSVHASRGPQGPTGEAGGPRQRPIKERGLKREKQEGPDSQVVVNGVS